MDPPSTVGGKRLLLCPRFLSAPTRVTRVIVSRLEPTFEFKLGFGYHKGDGDTLLNLNLEKVF